jgi:hypothetical protein
VTCPFFCLIDTVIHGSIPAGFAPWSAAPFDQDLWRLPDMSAVDSHVGMEAKREAQNGGSQ